MPLPQDHAARMDQVRLALDGPSVGDAFGERFFRLDAPVRIAQRALPGPPWRFTDDTEMALAIADVLAAAGRIDQDALARAFARRYAAAPDRGYGPGAYQLLHALCLGASWRDAAPAMFDGQGSLGNGGAMRAAPVGAYFADDLDALMAEAAASAEVTHAHPEGQAGAIAVAVAAACAWQGRADARRAGGGALLERVLDRVPRGLTADGIRRALALPLDAPVEQAARELGSGQDVTAMDTVPFALWCAARHLDDFEEALWATVSGLGDRDTTCAIVGGIVALAAPETIPQAWIAAREPLGFS
jgi:ADP-ribosylglycohydrolase